MFVFLIWHQNSVNLSTFFRFIFLILSTPNMSFQALAVVITVTFSQSWELRAEQNCSACKLILTDVEKSPSEADLRLSSIFLLSRCPPDMNYRSTLPHLCSKSSRLSSGLPWWRSTCSKCRPWTRISPEPSFLVRSRETTEKQMLKGIIGHANIHLYHHKHEPRLRYMIY